MNGPEWFSPKEEKQIAEMIETNVDFWQEQKYIREVIQDPDMDDDDSDGDLRTVIR